MTPDLAREVTSQNFSYHFYLFFFSLVKDIGIEIKDHREAREKHIKCILYSFRFVCFCFFSSFSPVVVVVVLCNNKKEKRVRQRICFSSASDVVVVASQLFFT